MMTAVAQRPPLRRAHKHLLWVHIVASVGLLGATSSSLLLALIAATTTDDALARSAYRLISTQSAAFGIPLSLLAIATGVALGVASKWGVLRYRWTTAKLGLVVLVMVNGALAIGPTTGARIDGDGSAWALPIALSATLAMLAGSVVLAVFKPGGRLRRGAGRVTARLPRRA